MELMYEVRSSGLRWKATALSEAEVVAELTWDKRTRVIDYVWTRPDHRRQGIATALFRYAVAHAPARPVHSRNRSADGRAWVASLWRTA
jgi:GNAT superfamily N-acetyltransferase